MIVVTGATGLLGSRLLFDLVSGGHEVRALKRDSGKMSRVDFYFSGHPDLMSQVEWVNADINDIFSLEEAFEGAHTVYHCAGKVSFQPSDHRKLHHINIQGTANVVNTCLIKNVKKLCFVSSIAALGRNGSDDIIDENAVWKSSKLNSVYAVSKYGAEREVWRGIAEGLDCIIVNPGVIIGPGNWKTDSSMLFRQVWEGLKFYTGGVNGFVDVRDVSKAMTILMESGVKNERFILVSENKPFREVMDRIADKINRKRAGIYAGPLLTALAWRMEYVKSLLTGSKPVITRETARSAQGRSFYSNEKIRKAVGMDFIPVAKSVDDTSVHFLNYKTATAIKS